MEATSSGCSLVNMFPTHSSSWWPIVEDIFSSPVVTALTRRLLDECVLHNEFRFLSVDGTVKCILPTMGQNKYSADAKKRKQGDCFPSSETIYRVITVRGATGAVVALLPSPSEKASFVAERLGQSLPPAALQQVEHVATDAPSGELFHELSAIMPSLKSLCLDPLHLAMKYEYSTGRHRTPGSAALRACLNKFNNVSPRASSVAFGLMFAGRAASPLTSQEASARQQILDGSMPQARAKRVLDAMPNVSAWATRLQFIEALAAISALHRPEVMRKSEKKGKAVYHHLYVATSAENIEWLFNNHRARAGLEDSTAVLLPSGTTSNEAFHAELRGFFKQIQRQHKSTLKLKLSVLLVAKLLQHNAALYFPTCRQMVPTQVLSRRLGSACFSDRAWRSWACPAEESRVPKARLPLQTERLELVAQVRDFVSKARPAKSKTILKRPEARNPAKLKRRTPFNLNRTQGIRRQGVAKRRPASSSKSPEKHMKA